MYRLLLLCIFAQAGIFGFRALNPHITSYMEKFMEEFPQHLKEKIKKENWRYVLESTPQEYLPNYHINFDASLESLNIGFVNSNQNTNDSFDAYDNDSDHELQDTLTKYLGIEDNDNNQMEWQIRFSDAIRIKKLLLDIGMEEDDLQNLWRP